MLGRILCKAVVGVLFLSVSAFARIGGLTDVDTGMEVWDADQRYLRSFFEGDVNITGTVSVVGDVRVNGSSVTNTMGNALLRTGGEMSGVLVAGRVHYLPVGTDIGAYIASTNVVAGDVVKLGAGEWVLGATQLAIGKSITLSGQGAGSTALSWDGPVGSYAGALSVSAAGVVLEGLTLSWDGILAYNEVVVLVAARASVRIDRVTILGESGSGSIRGIMAYGPGGKVELNDSIVDVNMGAQVGSERGSGLLLLGTGTGVISRSSIRIGTASFMQAIGIEGQGPGSLSLEDSRVVASGAGFSYGVYRFINCTIDGGYVSGGTYDLFISGTGPYVYPVLSPLTLGNGTVSTNIVLNYTGPSGSEGQLIAGAARFAGNVVATNGTIKARSIEGGSQTTPSGTVGLTMTAGVDADNFTAAGLVPVHATESVGIVATGEYGGVAKGSLISIYPDDRVDWDGLSMTNMFNVGATGIVVGGIDVRAGDGTSLTNLAAMANAATNALLRSGGLAQAMHGDLYLSTNMFYGQRFGINAGTNAYMTGGIAPLGRAHAFGGYAGANATGNYWHAFGLEAGRSATGNYWTAVGYRAGRYASGASWNALGQQAGEAASGTAWYAIGTGAGQYSSGNNWLAIGSEAGAGSTGNTWCAIGGYAVGKGAQGTDWSAIGRAAGFATVGDSWSAIGGYAGMLGLHTNSTSIGTYAGYMARGKSRLYIDVYESNPSYVADGATNDTIFIDSNAHLYLGGGAGRAQYPSAGGTLRGTWNASTMLVSRVEADEGFWSETYPSLSMTTSKSIIIFPFPDEIYTLRIPNPVGVSGMTYGNDYFVSANGYDVPLTVLQSLTVINGTNVLELSKTNLVDKGYIPTDNPSSYFVFYPHRTGNRGFWYGTNDIKRVALNSLQRYGTEDQRRMVGELLLGGNHISEVRHFESVGRPVSTPGTNTIHYTVYGAEQAGVNSGEMKVGSNAHGAMQRGVLDTTAVAENNAVGAIQLFNLASGQKVLTESAAAASLTIGAATNSHKNSIVVGDGAQSTSENSITVAGRVTAMEMYTGGKDVGSGLVIGDVVDRSYDITMPAWLSTTNTYTTAPAVSKLLVRANGTTAPFTKTVEVDWFAGDSVSDQSRLGRSVFGLETVAMSALASAGQNVVQVNQVGQLFDGDLLYITSTDGLVKEYARASVVMDTQAWQISYKGAQAVINCLAVYDGKLYAGQGNVQGAGDVLVFDGDRWRVSYDGSENSILSLAVHNGKLYAGQGTGTGDGDVFEFDGVSWVRIYDGTSSQIAALTSYIGNLFAGAGTASSPATAVLMAWNGISWAVSYVFAEAYVNALAVHGGFLYVGRGGSTAGSGKIDYWNGSAWISSFNGVGVYEVVGGMGIFDNTVFAGLGSSAGDGDVVYLSGGSWMTAWGGSGSQINALTPYDGKLYFGQGNLAASAAVYSYLSGVTTLRYSDSARSRIGALAEYDGVLYAGTSLTGDVLRHTPTGRVVLDRPLVNSYSVGALVHRVYEGSGWTGSTNTTLRIKTVSDVGGYGVKVIFKEVE